MVAEAASRYSPRRPPARLVTDTVVVFAVSCVCIGLAGSGQIGGVLPQPLTDQVLTLLAAVVAAAAAIVATIAARLRDDARPHWIGAAMALYATVVLPASVLVPTGGEPGALAGVRLVGYLGTALLLVGAVRPPRLSSAGIAWALAGFVALTSCALLFLPPIAQDVARGPVLTVAILVGWTAVAAAVVVDGYRRNSTPRWRVGLGLVVVALAQLARVIGVVPTGGQIPFFGFLRLLGLVVVLVGFSQLLARTLATITEQRTALQEEMASAAVSIDRAREAIAERDHELRNGLAGLAGIAHLLSSDAADAAHLELQHAVLAELGRLHHLLDSGARPVGAAEVTAYAVEPVVAGLVALRRTAGVDIRLDAEPRLAAVGSSALLAQVVTNLLANCDRHAPGAAVTIRTFRDGGSAVVEVRDTGPGLPPGATDVLFAKGVRDPDAGGLGFGLHLSQELIEGAGGTLHLVNGDDPPGCIARIAVPLAASDRHPLERAPGGVVGAG